MELILPYPPSILNPNKKLHWAVKSKATKKYRSDCYYATKASKAKLFMSPNGFYEFDVTFHPPDRRMRDRTNMEAAMKAAYDGMADALFINDIRFAPRYFLGEPVKGGKVVINV
jgi:crossover junction endodeoxyribonuclease RusA